MSFFRAQRSILALGLGRGNKGKEATPERIADANRCSKRAVMLQAKAANNRGQKRRP